MAPRQVIKSFALAPDQELTHCVTSVSNRYVAETFQHKPTSHNINGYVFRRPSQWTRPQPLAERVMMMLEQSRMGSLSVKNPPPLRQQPNTSTAHASTAAHASAKPTMNQRDMGDEEDYMDNGAAKQTNQGQWTDRDGQKFPDAPPARSTESTAIYGAQNGQLESMETPNVLRSQFRAESPPLSFTFPRSLPPTNKLIVFTK